MVSFSRLLFLGLLFFSLLAGCSENLSDEKTGQALSEIEIRNYEGENLSSVNDFRENSIKGPQRIDRETFKLEITGLVEEPKTYSYSAVLAGFEARKKAVTLDCVEGWSATILWEGVLVEDLVKEAKADESADTVIFRAYDGYSTALPLDYIEENDIIMAFKMNELELPPERGFPFQLVAESKWGYKWIKWITKIELSDNSDYRGHWESRGYSNSADLGSDFFD